MPRSRTGFLPLEQESAKIGTLTSVLDPGLRWPLSHSARHRRTARIPGCGIRFLRSPDVRRSRHSPALLEPPQQDLPVLGREPGKGLRQGRTVRPLPPGQNRASSGTSCCRAARRRSLIARLCRAFISQPSGHGWVRSASLKRARRRSAGPGPPRSPYCPSDGRPPGTAFHTAGDYSGSGSIHCLCPTLRLTSDLTCIFLASQHIFPRMEEFANRKNIDLLSKFFSFPAANALLPTYISRS